MNANTFKKTLLSVIHTIVHQHSIAPNHNKRKWLSLVANEYTTQELQQYGFSLTNSAVANAHKHARIYGPGDDVPPPQQPPSKRKNSMEVQHQVEEFLRQGSISWPAPYKCIVKYVDGKKILVPVAYLFHSITSCFTMFKRENPSVVISKSCFRKLIPKHFKKAKQATDLCPICEGKS